MVFSLTLHRINHLGPLAVDVTKYKTIFGTSNFVDKLKEKIRT